MNWIKVTERLPEVGKAVLVVSNSYVKYGWRRNKSHFKNPEKYSDWQGIYGLLNNVTHWMPLPEPPKD